MPTCPNCSYKLVLLSHRRKYKCAKCSRLFLQKPIENKDFRRQNKFHKELDLHNFNLELIQRKRRKLSPEEKLGRVRLRNNAWRKKNLERARATWRKWRARNKDKINTKNRQRYAKRKEHFIAVKKARRYKNIELTRLEGRIAWWKQRQKGLADAMLKNKQYEAYNNKIIHSVPTFVHCEVL